MSTPAGSRIVHDEHGPGTVLMAVAGRRARVRFDKMPDLPWTVREDDFELALDESAAGPSSAHERAAALQTIEALRTGVVPVDNIRDYTVAREKEIAALDRLFTEGRGCSVFWGDYGTGKTHLLDVSEQSALAAGKMAARIILNPRDIPPSHPQRLYRAIVASLRYPNSVGEGLLPLLEKLVDSPAHSQPHGERSSRFLSPVLFALKEGDPELIEWSMDYALGYRIDGGDLTAKLQRAGWKGLSVLTLSDFRTYARLFVHVLGTIAVWAKDAGFGGLTLLFDEVEFVDELQGDDRQFAMETLKHFAAVTLPKEELGFDPENLYKGGHEVHRRIPLLFREDQPLGCVFAFTPLEDIRKPIDEMFVVKHDHFDLSVLDHEAKSILFAKLAELFHRAYGVKDKKAADLALAEKKVIFAADQKNWNVRATIKAFIFAMDALYLRPPR